MANRPVAPASQSAALTTDQISRAIPRLQKRIADLEALDFSGMHERAGPAVGAMRVSIEQTLEDIFGASSSEFQRYRGAANITGGPITSSLARARGVQTDHRPFLRRSRDRAVALLVGAVNALEERQADLVVDTSPTMSAASHEDMPLSQRVFVVHGREGEQREAIARFLERLGLEPVILHELSNKGRTLITKFDEEASDIGFAIVLMTPDDVGGLAGAGQSARARQNVIFELGFFIGRLGSHRVAALVGTDVERPSDFEGVVYIPIDRDWRLPLCKELRAAGYDIDLNKVI